MLASAIAHESGCPPKVIPCVNTFCGSEKNGSIAFAEATTAPRGAYADVIPFASVIRSGWIPYRVEPNQSPTRPKPQMTSSATSRSPFASQISRTRSK